MQSHTATSDTRPLVIAVVGSGPRGISVLERLAVRTTAEAQAAAASGTAPRPVRVHLIDATEVGAGRVWRTDQDDWFTMNTVISQVTMYSGDPDGGPARPGAGPSLGQWIEERARTAGEELLGPDDYAPRVRYGEYLVDDVPDRRRRPARARGAGPGEGPRHRAADGRRERLPAQPRHRAAPAGSGPGRARHRPPGQRAGPVRAGDARLLDAGPRPALPVR